MQRRYLELDPFDLLTVSGPDNRRFLQGQVSCDMNRLSSTQTLLGALCNIKGRVIADFRAVDDGSGNCQLLLSPGLGDVVKSVLAKYIVFFKASLTSDTHRFRRLGLIGNDVHHLIQTVLGECPMADHDAVSLDSVRVFKLPGLVPRFEVLFERNPAVPTPQAEALLSAIHQHCDPCDLEHWLLEDFNAGIVHVILADSEHYLPQELNYDISGVIDFKKGCYTGQEIVARMFYRSKAKKRLFHLTGGTPSQSTPQQVYLQASNAEEKSLACPVVRTLLAGDAGQHLLAILPLEAMEEGRTVTVEDGVDNTPLSLLPLSYGVTVATQ